MRKFAAVNKIIAATGIVAALALPGTAAAVPHFGEVINGSSGGGSYSLIHKPSNTNGNGAKKFQFDASQAINYEWTTPGVLNGAQAIFGGAQGTPSFNLSGLNGLFDVVLTLGIAADASRDVNGTNTLQFGGLKSVASAPISLPGPDAIITNELQSGSINFSLSGGTTGGGGTLVGFFTWNPLDGSAYPFNGVGNIGASNNVAIGLWGLSNDLTDPISCQAGDCTDLIAQLGTNNNGALGRFGIDLVFTGVAQVPEPGALALFGIGLLGMGLIRRRRKSA